MKCLICGTSISGQKDLDGGWAPKYPHLCLEHNRRRSSEVLILAEDFTRYAFLPKTRIKGDEVAVAPDIFRKHPKNFWVVPRQMISTVLEKLYPLTEDEKAKKRRISDLRSELEGLQAEKIEIEAKIEELEEELEFNPDREVFSTWIKAPHHTHAVARL
jgi:hypothetical protein